MDDRYGRGDEVQNYPGGHEAYQDYLANTLGEQIWACGGIWCTTYGTMVSVSNQAAQAGTFYAESGYLGGVSDFTTKLKLDLHDSLVPLMPVLMSTNLPGWGGYGVAHWVTVKQYWEGGDTTTYGDTAGPYQRFTNPYGWHTVGLNWLYQQIVAADNDIVW